ncbi:metallopeptidase [Candidatus Bathyarchaeota archaeon]|nr:metallopeptidase [Candidatus Bathyarchaeota archaeon]
MIEYFDAPDIEARLAEIIDLLRFNHIKPKNVLCVRSRGSQAKRTLARIHGLGKIWQVAMGIEPTYIIEVISEQFDRLSTAGQDRTLVHELLHIPQGFQGGFRHHKDHVTTENVDLWFKRYQEKKHEQNLFSKK